MNTTSFDQASSLACLVSPHDERVSRILISRQAGGVQVDALFADPAHRGA
jgi:hypothetical protein